LDLAKAKRRGQGSNKVKKRGFLNGKDRVM